MKVMITDDSAFMRNILKKFLTENNISDIIEAENGQMAVEKYEQHKPDLCFMDIMMPIKTGLEALKEIKSKHPEANIVMCTSVGQEKVMEEAVDAGAKDFIIKPFKGEDIKEVLGNLK